MQAPLSLVVAMIARVEQFATAEVRAPASSRPRAHATSDTIVYAEWKLLSQSVKRYVSAGASETSAGSPGLRRRALYGEVAHARSDARRGLEFVVDAFDDEEQIVVVSGARQRCWIGVDQQELGFWGGRRFVGIRVSGIEPEIAVAAFG